MVGAAANDRFVYVASLDNLLRALRRGSGNQVWKRDLSTRTIAPPSTFGGIVLVTGNDPTLSTFDADSGAPIAKFSVAADLQGVPLVDSTLEPFRVAMVVVTRDARRLGFGRPDDVSRAASRSASNAPGQTAQQRAFLAPNSQSTDSQFPKTETS